jgi:hypothetical protein
MTIRHVVVRSQPHLVHFILLRPWSRRLSFIIINMANQYPSWHPIGIIWCAILYVLVYMQVFSIKTKPFNIASFVNNYFGMSNSTIFFHTSKGNVLYSPKFSLRTNHVKIHYYSGIYHKITELINSIITVPSSSSSWFQSKDEIF